jgi:gluconolactonase
MDGRIVASGLDFPEGPVWHDGSVYFVEIVGGVISRLDPAGAVQRMATTGGGPNGATLGADGHLYVTQSGGMPPGGRATPGIQRVAFDGAVESVVTEIDGIRLEGPNDLAFGPDGRLWFTDPRGAPDPEVNARSGRLFAVDVVSGEGELILELGPVFPNGIGFEADGSLVWTESFTRRVMRLRDGSPEPELVIELPERHMPDGFCVDVDGRLYVAATFAHCVAVVEHGVIVDRLMCGDGMATNCCFRGTDLIVTESRRGTLWQYDLGVEGLALH